MKKYIPFLVALFILPAACGADGEPAATSTSTTTTVVTSPAPDKPSDVDAKLSSHLISAADLADEGMAGDEIAAQVPVLLWDGDLVLIEITYDEVTADSVNAAEAAGLVVTGEYPDLQMVTGAAAPSSLRTLAALDGVLSIQPAFGATTNG